MTRERQYHAIVRGQQQGPFSREELARLVSRGEVEVTTLAWTEGMSVWRPLPEVPGLHNLLAEGPPPELEPEARAVEALLPEAVDTALDKVSRSQAFIIGAGMFFGLIAILGIGNIFTFNRLALLGFWGSAILAVFAYQAWRQEESGELGAAAETSFRGAIGSGILAIVSLIFGNFFFGVLQIGAGALFWLARTELQKQPPAAGASAPTTDDRPPTTDLSAEASLPTQSSDVADAVEVSEPETGDESVDG